MIASALQSAASLCRSSSVEHYSNDPWDRTLSCLSVLSLNLHRFIPHSVLADLYQPTLAEALPFAAESGHIACYYGGHIIC